MARYLRSCSSGRGHLPDSPWASARRGKIDPPSISRPAWYNIGRCLTRELTRLTALRIHHEDIGIAGRSRVEGDLLSVWRPTRRSGHIVEMGELDEIGAITAAHPY